MSQDRSSGCWHEPQFRCGGSQMKELIEQIYCPKCKASMIFYVDQKNPGPDRNLGTYRCGSFGMKVRIPDRCNETMYDIIWTIDGITYTDAEIERSEERRVGKECR